MFLRLTRCRWKVKIYVLVVCLLIFFLCLYFDQYFRFLLTFAPVTVAPASNGRISRHLSKLITVVFRQFEDFENDVPGSVQSFISTFPNMPVLVVCDSAPYPPFPFATINESLRNVRVISLELKLNSTPEELNPLSFVNTEYVLLAPDGTRVSRRVLQRATAAATLTSNPMAIGIGGSKLICQFIQWRFEDWTIEYSKDISSTLCDAVHGQHALLVKTSLLHSLPKPFALPLPEALYLQTAIRNIKVQIFEGQFGSGHGIKTPASKKLTLKRVKDNRVALFKQLGIKAVLRDNEMHWFGCKKETQRCFPSVHGTPSYVLAGRNTPPCCRQNLRRTLTHVLHSLLTAGARCWLETTSLLGAVTSGDILPYAEYGEIGVHASDIQHIPFLSRGGVDSEGYIWERATRGRYYRVAYSRTNRMYVLLLPFVPKNGTMWPQDWVLAHQKEFPERHLHPLAQIGFVGRQAPAPNDARAFLDLKLGTDAVERTNWLGSRILLKLVNELKNI